MCFHRPDFAGYSGALKWSLSLLHEKQTSGAPAFSSSPDPTPVSFPFSFLPQSEPSYYPKAMPSSDEGTQAMAGPIGESSLHGTFTIFPSYIE